MVLSIYPGTEITFLPVWIANSWRVLTWFAIILIVVKMTINSAKSEQVSRIIVYDRAALMVLLLAGASLDAERWGDPITLEGLPPITIALYLIWRAVVAEDHWRWLHRNRDT
jgi:hypothetical protein